MAVQDGTWQEIYLCAAWPCQNAEERGRSALERDLSMYFRHHKQTRKSVSRINITSQGEGARGCLMAVWDRAKEEIYAYPQLADLKGHGCRLVGP